ncbi:NUDIX domain-containing protein, partial [Mycobacterium tuberculosis]|nr:NUDIX domain-containing protein [Mycobacterium tuberculosis]
MQFTEAARKLFHQHTAPSLCRRKPMRHRTIVCPLIENEGHYLLCKMAADRGVFPGQWALSGGGVEPGERIE